MNLIKSGYVFLAFMMISVLSVSAQAQSTESNYIRGYVPPPMFGGSSRPVDGQPLPKAEPAPPPVVAPAPVQEKPAPVKEQVKAAPVKEMARPPEERKPAPQPQIAKKVEAEKPPAPVKKTAKTSPPATIDAEALLNHPVTAEQKELPIAALNPMAVPAADVEDALPLPGSVKPQKPLKAPKTEKPLKKEAKKTEPKKPVVKAEPKKTETAKKEVKKTLPSKKEPPKEVVKAEPKKLPEKAPVKAPEKEPVKDTAAYNVKGKKSMPKVASTKVEKAELDKPVPPPVVAAVAADSLPLPNKKPDAAKEPLTLPDVQPSSEITAATPEKTSEKAKPQLISLEFKNEQSEISSDTKQVIDSSILPKLTSDTGSRLQILSYASSSKEGQSSARRISLARGLAIRSYLLEKGMKPERIDIRALGENTTEKPLDRADLMIISYK